MVIGPAPGSHVDAASTQNGQSAAALLPDIPPRWAFWLPILAAGIGGLMLGSLFFMAAYMAQATAYRITFGMIAGACLILPPLLVWLIVRWMWSVLDEERRKETVEP